MYGAKIKFAESIRRLAKLLLQSYVDSADSVEYFLTVFSSVRQDSLVAPSPY